MRSGFDKVIAVFLFCLALPIVGHASWNGTWSGDAGEESSYYKTPGVLTLLIEQTDSTWSLKECSFKTSYSNKKWGPNTFRIQDGKLFQDQLEVGTISAEYVYIHYEAKGATGNVTMEYSLELSPTGSLKYTEIYLMNKQKFYTLKGNLNPYLPSSLSFRSLQEFSTSPNSIPNTVTLASR